jgi:hypothetical protein
MNDKFTKPNCVTYNECTATFILSISKNASFNNYFIKQSFLSEMGTKHGPSDRKETPNQANNCTACVAPSRACSRSKSAQNLHFATFRHLFEQNNFFRFSFYSFLRLFQPCIPQPSKPIRARKTCISMMSGSVYELVDRLAAVT